jgi:murein DD-endopeptidase MepM/ murein hydrolase activator NlpD
MQAIRVRVAEFARDRVSLAVAILAVVAGSAAIAAPVAAVSGLGGRDSLQSAVERAARLTGAEASAQAMRLVWTGLDVDGDGQSDFANPTGGQTRGLDAYGYGEFGASRDGGSRHHEGVDFIAQAGQAVTAPISGYVTKIGFAYSGDNDLQFVEITNPALQYAARVFYINPTVAVGDAVRVGGTIGAMHSLQAKYPAGMTDHVHLEIIDTKGRRIDATRVLTARYVPVASPNRG